MRTRSNEWAIKTLNWECRVEEEDLETYISKMRNEWTREDLSRRLFKQWKLFNGTCRWV